MKKRDEKLYLLKLKMCDLIFSFNTFLRNFCLDKQKWEEAKEAIKDREIKSQQFEKVEKNLPKLFNAVEQIKTENEHYKSEKEILKEEVKYFYDTLYKLYNMDISSDVEGRIKIYKQLGFIIEKVEK